MIAIVLYQSAWPEQFARLGRILRRSLGTLALRIDHIGSTSVPGLAAKDVIDIQITARALTPELDEAVGRAGYRRLVELTQDHVPPGGSADPVQWSKWFYEQRGAQRVNLHVRVAGRANQRYAVLFRDFLRANPTAAAAYGQVKVALAGYHSEDEDAYYAVKDPVCDILLAGAEAWAATVGWMPGPSDQ
jgi:GrpB-like predicted nucleotidyltransferase (UPF0157 family)